MSPGETPNSTTILAKNYISSNPVLKAIENDIILANEEDDQCLLRYIYYDPLPNDALEKLEIQFIVEKDDQAGNSGQDVVYVLSKKHIVNRTKDIGQSFNKFKDKLNEVTKECIDELFGHNDFIQKKLHEGQILKVIHIKPGATFTLAGNLGDFKQGEKIKVTNVVRQGEDVRIDFENNDEVHDSFYFDPSDEIEID